MEDNAAKRNRQIKQEKQVKAGRRVSRKCQEQRRAILYNIRSIQLVRRGARGGEVEIEIHGSFTFNYHLREI